MTSPARVPHIVMLAGNDVTTHPRVLKYVATAAHFGMRVSAIGLSSTDTHTTSLGEATLFRVAVSTNDRRRLSRHRPWFWTKQEYAAGLRAFEALRDQPGADRRRVRIAKLVLALRARPWKLRERRLVAVEGRAGMSRRRALGTAAYTALPWLAPWRSVHPEALHREQAILPLLDELEPDLIHVHDVFLLGVGVRAAERARARGRKVAVVYDAHENIPGLAVGSARWVAGYASLEAEFIRSVDRVITVSEPLVDLLTTRHRLDRRPSLVLNAPVHDDGRLPVIPLRELVGLAPDVPLAVYAGGVNRARGLLTLVDALPLVPELHLAVVNKATNPAVRAVLERARRLGVDHRVHVAPYVPHEVVPRYLASASLGTSPLLHVGNHDVALTNKFCEYVAAGLPVVTSDTPAQADLVRELDLGAVHIAGDPMDCAAALRRVIDDLPRLRTRIGDDAALRQRFSWSAQAEVLRDVWGELLGGLPDAAFRSDATNVTAMLIEPSAKA